MLSSSGPPATHFLSQARHTRALGPRPGDSFDISTVAAADYDVDVQSGFMPPAEPVLRLNEQFSIWEEILDLASDGRVKLATDLVEATEDERLYARAWRDRVLNMPIIPADPLSNDERRLRRAHVALSFLLHFFVHSSTHDTSSPISIPASISVPLIAVSRELGLPPVLTYADTVLWNWKHATPPSPSPSPSSSTSTSSTWGDRPVNPPSAPWPSPSNITTHTSFSGTTDENAFYMTSARIELRGVEALSLMRRTLDETFLSDNISSRRVTSYLTRLARVIDDITVLINEVRKDCAPGVFYDRIRPWFHGASAHSVGGGWSFEGVQLSEREGVDWGRGMGGPSAGQSSLVHALDVFLGVRHEMGGHGGGHGASAASGAEAGASGSGGGSGGGRARSHSHAVATSASTPPPPSSPSSPPSTSDPSSPPPTTKNRYASPDSTFLQRMQQYMPRHHRAFLQYLGTVSNPVRGFVLKQASLTPPTSFLSSSPSFPSHSSALLGEEGRDGGEEGKNEPPLTKAYNEAVDALKRFRDAHIRIATLYIVSQARRDRTLEAAALPTPSSLSPPSAASSNSPDSSSSPVLEKTMQGLRIESSTEKKERGGAVGTGGTQLVPFLKGARDNTIRTALR